MHGGQDGGGLLEADHHDRVRAGSRQLVHLGIEVVGAGCVGDERIHRAAQALEVLHERVGQTLPIGLLAIDHPGDPVSFRRHQVRQDLALQQVRGSGTEVETVVVIGREVRGGVGRGEMDHIVTGDLVDHQLGHSRTGRTDNRIHIQCQEPVNLGIGDVLAGVTRVTLVQHHISSEHTTGRVDVSHRPTGRPPPPADPRKPDHQ